MISTKNTVHTITSPHKIIPAAPTTLSVVTMNIKSKTTINANIVSMIITSPPFVSFITQYVYRAKQEKQTKLRLSPFHLQVLHKCFVDYLSS